MAQATSLFEHYKLERQSERISVMKMSDFIRENREEIDNIINSVLYRHDGNGGCGVIPNPPPTRNDKERRDFISNDEGLYNWARSSRVKV